jgi:PqqD family protein of HPr-rel-A system
VYQLDPTSLIIQPLDSFDLVFHRPSGQTHLLASPARELVAALDTQPCDIPTLTARLEQQFGLSAAADTTTVLAARLDELVAIGLIIRL